MKELKNYYRQIRGWLPCGGSLKKQLMANITATVEDYLADNPDADFAAVQAHFGTPQQIATAFVDEMNTEELLKKLKLRRNILAIVLCCITVIILIWAVAVGSSWITAISDIGGYGITGSVISK